MDAGMKVDSLQHRYRTTFGKRQLVVVLQDKDTFISEIQFIHAKVKYNLNCINDRSVNGLN